MIWVKASPMTSDDLTRAPSGQSPQTTYYRLIWPTAICAVITFASSRSQVAGGFLLWIPAFDKVAHFFLFGLLGTLFYRLRGSEHLRFGRGVLAIAAATLFGVSDECHQYINPNRLFETADILADLIGATTAVITYRFWPGYRTILEYDLRFGKKR